MSNIENKGDCAPQCRDILSQEGICKYLSYEISRKLDVEVLESVESTNNIIRQYAVAGEAQGKVVIAGMQTNGRGRRGRQFFSPSDSGIYMSVLLRPEIEAEGAVSITTAAAAAVCEAIEKVSDKSAEIKWVNDIFIGGKKVCGILTEASFESRNKTIEYAVMGIGINVYEPDGGFPKEIENIAASLTQTPQKNFRNHLAAQVLNRFMYYYLALDEKKYMQEYKRRSLVLGKEITVCSQNQSRAATAIDLDDNCRLKVRYDDETEEYISSGEISIKL